MTNRRSTVPVARARAGWPGLRIAQGNRRQKKTKEEVFFLPSLAA